MELILCLLGAALWLLALVLLFGGTRSARVHMRKSPPHMDAPFNLLPISVLKPMKGLDVGVRENIRSFLAQDYPQFEIIFSVADAHDPVRPVIEAALKDYPGVKAALIVGDVQVGPNPKVNNLIHSYQAARHDWILISDSNVRVAPDYLRRQAAHLDNGVGVLTSVVGGFGAEGSGARLESVFLNTFYARCMTLAFWAKRPVVIGKSMLFRRSMADRFGGIRAMARYLAEDYMMGEAMRKLGLRVVLAHDTVPQYIGQRSVREFWLRHVRWGRIRKSQEPLLFYTEFLVGSHVSGLIGAWAFGSLLGLPTLPFFLGHMLLWLFNDARVASAAGRPLGWRDMPVWLMREASAFPLWLHTAVGNSVEWRGRRLRLHAHGLLESAGT